MLNYSIIHHLHRARGLCAQERCHAGTVFRPLEENLCSSVHRCFILLYVSDSDSDFQKQLCVLNHVWMWSLVHKLFTTSLFWSIKVRRHLKLKTLTFISQFGAYTFSDYSGFYYIIGKDTIVAFLYINTKIWGRASMTFKINVHIHDIILWHRILNLYIYIFFFLYLYIYLYIFQLILWRVGGTYLYP